MESFARRMPLRQLLTHSEKITRDLVESLRVTLGARLAEYRDLSRPVRRRSSYPSMVSMANGLRKVHEAAEEIQQLAEYLAERLEEIRQHAHS